jgi:predicted Rdx family selenoprotein
MYSKTSETIIDTYEFDPANFITAASYAWSCMLLNTGAELELITDPKILDIFERSKRGGLTSVGSKRFAKQKQQIRDRIRPLNEINLPNVVRR